MWVPHDLTTKNLIDRISILKLLLKWNEIESFLKWLIMGIKNESYNKIIYGKDCG